MTGLLPCPLCGSEALIERHEAHTHEIARFMPDYPGSVTVECQGADCGAAIIQDTWEKAVAVWNRRTPLAPDAARTEREIEAMARAIYDERHKGLRNCWSWDDSGLDEEHPGVRASTIRQARAAYTALAKARQP